MSDEQYKKYEEYIKDCKRVYSETNKALDYITYGASIVLVPLIMTVSKQIPEQWYVYWMVSSVLFVAVIVLSVYSNRTSQKACEMAIDEDDSVYYASGDKFKIAKKIDSFRDWIFGISLFILILPIIVNLVCKIVCKIN